MRDQSVIGVGSPCNMDFYDPSLQTRADFAAKQEWRCPRFAKCSVPGELGPGGHECVKKMALQIVQFALREGHSVEEEMKTFRQERPMPHLGYFDTEKQDFRPIPGFPKAADAIETYTHVILGDGPTPTPPARRPSVRSPLRIGPGDFQADQDWADLTDDLEKISRIKPS